MGDATRADFVGGQFCSAAAITPSDSAANIFDAIWVGSVGGGTALKLTTEGGSVVTLTVAAGQLHRIRTALVWSTGTTASALVGLRA